MLSRSLSRMRGILCLGGCSSSVPMHHSVGVYNNRVLARSFHHSRIASSATAHHEKICDVSDNSCFSPLDTLYTEKIQNVLIVKKWQSRSATESASQIAKWLSDRNIQVFIEPTTVSDYDREYPTLLDLSHHCDLASPKHVSSSFPTLATTSFNSQPSYIHAVSNMNGSVENKTDHPGILNPLKKNSFWKTFTRSVHLKETLASLDPRECIAYSRRHNRWNKVIDVVIAIGGDGTLLHVSSLFPNRVPPVLCFGSGSFGFLMPFSPSQYERHLERLLNGEQRVYNRERVAFKVNGQVGVTEDGAYVVPPFEENDTQCFHLLNETVLKHSYGLNVGSGVSEIECRVDGHLLAKFQGDGVMIASPTGSTAYSLAAGGSIVHPSLQCLLVVPVAPMTLSSRPLILPPKSTIQLKPLRDSVLLEGKYGRVIQPGEVVTVRQSDYPIPVFARDTVTKDFVSDLGNRMHYARMMRIKRTSDDIVDGPEGSFLSKRTET